MVSVVLNVPDGFTHLNWVDYLFLVVLVYSVLSGAWIGFFAECLSLAGVAGGTFAAGLTYHDAGKLLAHVNVPEDARDWAGFVAVFVAISLVCRLFSIKAHKLSSVLVAGQANQLAGGLMGVIVGSIICLFALVTVSYFQVGKVVDPLYNSQIAQNSKGLVQEYVTLLPVKMHKVPWPCPTASDKTYYGTCYIVGS